jgi:hypothetical protein
MCPLDILISSVKRMFATTPPLTGHPSIEGNKTDPSVFTARSAKIIPLRGGVARSAGVVAGLLYCWNHYKTAAEGE